MKSIVVITALESFVVASVLVLWRYMSKHSKVTAVMNVKSRISAPEDFSTNRTGRDPSRWAFINGWKVSPQRDDRTPMLGDAVTGSPSATVNRSLTRRRHQEKFKEWSQGRHDY